MKSHSRVQLFATPWTAAPGSSIHGIFQAIILEWVAISFSRGSSWRSSPGIKPSLPDCRQTLYHLSHKGSPRFPGKLGKPWRLQSQEQCLTRHRQPLGRSHLWVQILQFIHHTGNQRYCQNLWYCSLWENGYLGTSLVVQWLRLCTPNARDPGSISGLKIKSHILQQRPGAPKINN